jgi:DNA-binding NarL/FixJ family response regulator
VAVTRRLRVVVADDAFLVREGLLRAVGRSDAVEVVGSAEDLDELRAVVDETEPDVVITDIRMPPTRTDEGLRVAIELRKTHPDVAVILLSDHAKRSYALELFADGAARRGYLLKERIADETYLLESIEAVAEGRPMLDSKIVELVVGAKGRELSHLDDLSEREREVLALVAEGSSNAAIAKRLVITRRAVERHINAIFAKLELEDTSAVNRRVLAALLFARASD